MQKNIFTLICAFFLLMVRPDACKDIRAVNIPLISNNVSHLQVPSAFSRSANTGDTAFHIAKCLKQALLARGNDITALTGEEIFSPEGSDGLRIRAIYEDRSYNAENGSWSFPVETYYPGEAAEKTVRRTARVYTDGSVELSAKNLGAAGSLDPDNDLRGLIRSGNIVKIDLKTGKYYEPRYIENYGPGTPDVNKEVSPILLGHQLDRLKDIFLASGINPNSLTVAVVKNSAYLERAENKPFVLAHTGETTLTVWIGELLLKYCIDNHVFSPSLQYMTNHEVRHIKDPRTADADHGTSEYKMHADNLNRACSLMETIPVSKKNIPQSDILHEVVRLSRIPYPEHYSALEDFFKNNIVKLDMREKQKIFAGILSLISREDFYTRRQTALIFAASLFITEDYPGKNLVLKPEQLKILYALYELEFFRTTEFFPEMIGGILSDENISIYGDPGKSNAMALITDILWDIVSGPSDNMSNSYALHFFEWNLKVLAKSPEELGSAILAKLRANRSTEDFLSLPILRHIMCNWHERSNMSEINSFCQKTTDELGFKVPERIDTAQKAIETLFGDDNLSNSKKFFLLASSLRYFYDLSYKRAVESPLPPLEYTIKNRAFVNLGNGLYLSPITESFRRHIVFGMDDNGNVLFSFEVRIPGDIDTRHEVGSEHRKKIASHINDSYPDKNYCVKVLFTKHFPDGQYGFYGEKYDFSEKEPLNIIIYDYSEDGKRLDNITDALKKQKNIRDSIISQVAEITAAVHDLGYIGMTPMSGFDNHLGNFRYIKRKDGSVKVILVGDFGVFENVPLDFKRRSLARSDRNTLIYGNGSKIPGIVDLFSFEQNVDRKEIEAVFESYYKQYYDLLGTGTASETADDTAAGQPVLSGKYWWEEKKQRGILCPMFSGHRYSGQGIGDLEWLSQFLDFLSKEKADMLVMLPTNQTGYDDSSPYSSISMFANNAIAYLPLDEILGMEHLLKYRESFVEENTSFLLSCLNNHSDRVPQHLRNVHFQIKQEDLQNLPESELRDIIKKKLSESVNRAQFSARINYPLALALKEYMMKSAFRQIYPDIALSQPSEFGEYLKKNSYWIDDYALFHSLLNHHNGLPWWKWGRPFRDRDKDALSQYENEHKEDILFYKYIQWQYYEYWQTIRRKAGLLGKKINGDMPIYPSSNSADVWSRRDLFDLTKTAGAEPDLAGPEGQNWGTYPYRWGDKKNEVLDYWIKRVEYMSGFYDGVRIDHVLGLFSEWVIPLGMNASDGEYSPSNADFAAAQGEEIIRVLSDVALKQNVLLIVEDIGLRPDVIRRKLDQLSLELPNIFLYNPVGWRDTGLAGRKHVMVVEATHDTPARFSERWPGMNSDPSCREQVRGYLDAHGISMAADSDNVEQQVLEAMKKEDFACFTLQTVTGDPTDINTPGAKGPFNWTWVSPEMNTLLKRKNSGLFEDDAPVQIERPSGLSYKRRILSSGNDERYNALYYTLDKMKHYSQNPLISVDLDDTLAPFGAKLGTNALRTIIDYLEAGGLFALNTLAEKEYVYPRVIEPLMNELEKTGRLDLMRGFFLIVSAEQREYRKKDVYQYDLNAGNFKRIISSPYSTKANTLRLLLGYLQTKRVSCLAYYGDNFNMFLNDDSALGMGDIPNVMNVGKDLSFNQVNMIAQSCVESGFYDTVNNEQHIFNTRQGGFGATLNDISDITELMKRMGFDKYREGSVFKLLPAAKWTFDDSSDFRADINQPVKISVGMPGTTASGFVWAGTKNSSGEWKKDSVYLAPLRLNKDGYYEALLPHTVDTFTFFWTGGPDALSGSAPGHWEGKDFTIERIQGLMPAPQNGKTAGISFLKNIAEEDILAENLVNAVQSCIDDGKRLVIACHKGLSGMKNKKLLMVLKRLKQWKEETEDKNPAMAELLLNFNIIEYANRKELKSRLTDGRSGSMYMPESALNDPAGNLIFTFEPYTDDATPDTRLGPAERRILIKENGDFSDNDYYPLAEIITLALSKELIGCRTDAILWALSDMQVNLDDLNIEDITEDDTHYMVFSLIPYASPADIDASGDRYARLLLALRSA